MKKNWNLTVGAATFVFLALVSVSYAQYGACGPTCALPEPACAPTCALPEPACAPTCALPEPTCAPTCAPGFASGCGLGVDPCNPCNPCGLGVFSIVDGAARAVVAPFKWLACAMTDGVYPDCGCAPRPPKSNCDPCTICGDYVGGCNDQCRYGQNCNSYCDGSQGFFQQGIGAQNVEYYDAEAYDSSPTRANVGVQNFKARALEFSQNDPIQTRRSENAFLAQNAAAPLRGNAVRAVNYERSVAQNANVAPRVAEQVVRNDLQNAQNVRIISHRDAQMQTPQAAAKTFGQTRPVK